MLAATTLAVATLTVAAAPAYADHQDGPQPTDTIHGVSCTNIQQIGVGGSAVAEGVIAVKVWQYKGWCRGTWQRFSYVRVTDAFRAKPWGFQGTAGLRVEQTGSYESGFTSVWNDRGIYSQPADYSTVCTRGFGFIKYIKNGVTYASDVALTTGNGPGC